MNKRILAALTLLLLCGLAYTPAAPAADFSVKQTWKIGHEGGWDYLTVDPAAQVLYIARGTKVDVVDLKSGALVTEMGPFLGTHGVALDSAGKFGYVSDGRDNSVRVFDRKSYALVARIPAGQNPDSILFEPSTQRVFAFNGRSKDITVIDAANNQVLGTIAAAGKLETGQTDGKGTVWVNIEDKNQIQRIDAKTMTVTATWPVAPCEAPGGLAFDGVHRRLFSTCDEKKMVVTDADSGKVVATLPIGDGPDAAGFYGKDGLVFSSNGQDGTLSILQQKSADSYTPLQTLATQKSARTLAVDSFTGMVYLVAAKYGPAAAPTADAPRPRPAMLPDSFVVLAAGR